MWVTGANQTGLRTAPSIPSKFEATTVAASASGYGGLPSSRSVAASLRLADNGPGGPVARGMAGERDAFLTRTPRFRDRRTAIPGPGAYETNPRPLGSATPSFGKRGYGVGFASRTPRFGPLERKRRRRARRTPGPGSYDYGRELATGLRTAGDLGPNALQGAGRNRDPRHPNGRPSHVFRPPIAVELAPSPSPGPADYGAPVTAPDPTAPAASTAAAAFKSKTRREHQRLPPTAFTPGPGEYRPDLPPEARPNRPRLSKAAIRARRAPRAPFGTATRRETLTLPESAVGPGDCTFEAK